MSKSVRPQAANKANKQLESLNDGSAMAALTDNSSMLAVLRTVASEYGWLQQMYAVLVCLPCWRTIAVCALRHLQTPDVSIMSTSASHLSFASMCHHA